MLNLRLLGGASIESEDGPLSGPVAQRHRLALLSLLAFTHPAALSRDKLIAYLWPERAGPSARNLLSQAVHAIRKVLGAGVIRSSGAELRLDASFIACDLIAFREAIDASDVEAAAALYRGPFLDGFFLPDALEFEHWVESGRRQLADQLGSALEDMAERAGREGDPARAVDAWRRLLELDRGSSRVVLRLMRALEEAGDRAAAIREADRHSAWLAEELDARPDPEVAALAVCLRAGLAIGSARATDSPHGEAASPAAAPPDRTPALVGRAAEYERLCEAWDLAQSDGLRMAVISGEPGIGKTRLAEELLDRAARNGIAVARTRSWAAEGRLAFAPVTEWLRSGAVRQRLGALDPTWIIEVSRLLPELRPAGAEPHDGASAGGSWRKQRLFEGLVRAILALPDPLLLLLDDLQWTDPDTIEWLHYLLRSERRAPVLIVGTVRLGEVAPDDPLHGLIRALRRRRAITEIALSALGKEATTALGSQLAGRAMTDAEAASLHHETEGHPLFIVESIRARHADEQRVPDLGVEGAVPADGPHRIPKTVRAVIRARLAQLSPAARDVADLAAVVGREFTSAVVAHASGLDDAGLAAGLDELWRRRIIRVHATDVYDFSHDKLREVAQADISPARRCLLHRRVAQALESLHASDLDSVSARIASHYEHAGDPVRAIPFYERAAEAARRVFAIDDAIDLLRRALFLLDSMPAGAQRDERELSLQLGLGMCLMSVRGWSAPEVGAALERANALSDSASRQDRIRILFGIHTMYLVRAPREGRRFAEAFLELVQEDQNPTLLAAGHFAVGSHAWVAGEFASAAGHLEQALDSYDPGEAWARASFHLGDIGALSLAFLSHTRWQLGYPERAVAESRRGIALAESLDHPLSLAIALSYAAMLHQYRDEPSDVTAFSAKASAVCAEYDIPYYRAWSTIMSGWAESRLGRVEEGVSLMREGLAAFDEMGAGLRRPYYLALIAEGWARLGRLEEALGLAQQALRIVPDTGDYWVLPDLHRLHGDLLASTGHGAEAESHIRTALSLARRQESRTAELEAAISLAKLALDPTAAGMARRDLREIRGRFTEGHDTHLLRRADTLLGEED